MGQQSSHLSSDERILIEKLHCERHPGIRRTAEEIGRDKSTVSRELRRGLWAVWGVITLGHDCDGADCEW